MTVFNLKMLELLVYKIVKSRNIELSPGLQEILEQGFMTEKDCYFLKKLFGQPHIKSSDFIDKTGYECFINSVHIDDYANQDVFEQALLFSEKLLELWSKLGVDLVLKVDIGDSGVGFNVKCHVERENEVWINEAELEVFDEALMVISSR